MRRISRDERATDAVTLRSSSVDLERRNPSGIAERGVARSALVESRLEMRQRQVSAGRRLLRFHDDTEPLLARFGNREEQTFGVNEAVQLVVAQAPLNPRVGQAEPLRVGFAREG